MYKLKVCHQSLVLYNMKHQRIIYLTPNIKFQSINHLQNLLFSMNTMLAVWLTLLWGIENDTDLIINTKYHKVYLPSDKICHFGEVTTQRSCMSLDICCMLATEDGCEIFRSCLMQFPGGSHLEIKCSKCSQ